MKKRNITFAILLLAVVLTAVGVSGTYARYITTDSGTGTATVAKWSAVVGGWGGTTTAQTLALEPVENPYVANNVIAPDSDAAGILTVDLTGTQVSTDLMASLGEVKIGEEKVENGHFTTKMRIYASTVSDEDIKADLLKTDINSTALAKITSSTQKYNIALNAGKTALVNEKVKVAVSLHWIHDDEDNDDLTDGMNGWDTDLGEYGTGSAPVIKATINLTAQQHVLSDGTPS